MAVTSKMAAWMKKQITERRPEDRAVDIKDEMDYIEMGRMSKKELEEIAKGRGRKADIADLELSRRNLNKKIEKETPGFEDEKIEKAYSTTEYKKYRNPDPNEMAKGGMAKKKVAAKKPAVKKPAVKKPIKRGK